MPVRPAKSSAPVASPSRAFFVLTAIAVGLLWLPVGDAAPLRDGLTRALEPGVDLARWCREKSNRIYGTAVDSAPPADAFGRRAADRPPAALRIARRT